jgi:outer membrane immunogenic protein
MKGLLVGIVGAIALKAPPSAADLAARPCAKAPPPATAAVYDWNGFYIGINGGSGSSFEPQVLGFRQSAYQRPG